MKLGILGGGSWGTTLAQALYDNNHSVLIYDINKEHVDKINNLHLHPFFDKLIPSEISATTNLEQLTNFTDIIVICVPTKVMRIVFKQLKTVLKNPVTFINVSKGIEPETSMLTSQIIKEELGDLVQSFTVLSGPSHAEELIDRKLTALVSASNNLEDAKFVQNIFSNKNYLRVYTSQDVVGVEVGGAIKNAIAFISGVANGLGLGENARAALITRGIREIIKVVEVYGGSKETAYGLSGVGDLIVTASSLNSRNFQAGFKIGQGQNVKDVLDGSKMIVEGVRSIEAAHFISIQHNIELPTINMAYEVLFGDVNTEEGLEKILTRELKNE